jgi:hypothetical protein
MPREYRRILMIVLGIAAVIEISLLAGASAGWLSHREVRTHTNLRP